MTITVEDTKFERVCETSLDRKERITLAKALRVLRAHFGDVNRLRFAVHCNHAGQILLVPETAIPLHEAWLYKNTHALKSVLTGIEQAERGELGPPLAVSADDE